MMMHAQSGAGIRLCTRGSRFLGGYTSLGLRFHTKTNASFPLAFALGNGFNRLAHTSSKSPIDQQVKFSSSSSGPQLSNISLSGIPGGKNTSSQTSSNNLRLTSDIVTSSKTSSKSSIAQKLLQKFSRRKDDDGQGEPTENLSTFFSLAKPESKSLGIAFLLLLVSSAVTLSVPMVVGTVVDIFSGTKTDLPVSLPTLTALIVGILAIGAVSNVVRYILLRNSGIRIIGRLRQDAYGNVLKMDAAWFDLYKTKDLTNDKLTKEISSTHARRHGPTPLLPSGTSTASGASAAQAGSASSASPKAESQHSLSASEKTTENGNRIEDVEAQANAARGASTSSRSGTVADIVSRLGTDASAIGNCLTQDLADAARASVLLVSALGLMIMISPKMTALMLITVPVLSIAAFAYGQYVKKLSFRLQSALGDLQSLTQTKLSAIRTVQAFNAAFPMEMNEYIKKNRLMQAIQFREARVSAFFNGSLGFTGYITMLGLIAYGGLLVSQSALTFGSLTSLLMYALYIGSNATVVMNFISKLMMTLGATSRVFELIRAKPVSVVPGVGKSIPKLSVSRPVTFDKVSFAYPSRPNVPILRDFNLKIAPGTSIAIAGASGSGKSTIGLLLARFYDPASGAVLYGDSNIRSFTPESWRTQFAYVSQEPTLFAGTIADNIRYGNPSASMDEVKVAADLANCKFVYDFPLGFDTNVGAGGSQLSGGQRQRIAIARALLTRAPILIADEATSALDVTSETIVNESLRKIHRESPITVVIIAHRLSTLRSADKIVYVKDGSVAEMGSFEELTQPGTQFSEFIRSQLEI